MTTSSSRPSADALRWAMLERLFDGALAVPHDARASWIAAHCADVTLREELEAMLAAHGRVTGILDRKVPSRIDAVRARMSQALAGKYTILEVLGAGGSASVFRACEHKHDRQVVLKVLHPDLAAQIGVRRFLREVRIAAQLGHPHILPLIDSGEADGLLYYVMPSVNGETLRERLRNDGVIAVGPAVTLLRDIAGALAAAHAAGIVHRDLKPENVLCVGDHAFLLDFGIAVHQSRSDQRHTGEGIAIGTPGYMSPEQASGDVVDTRSDVYSWGVLATEMLTGHIPAPATRSQNLPVSRALADVIDCARSLDPMLRPADGQALVQALQEIETPSLAAPRTTPRRRALTVAATLLFAVAAGAWAWMNRTPTPKRGAGMATPVAVATLRNETGDSTLDIWGRMASDWLTQGLHETSRVTVVPWSQVRLAEGDSATDIADKETLTRFARETGASTVVSGRYYLVGNRVQFRLDVTDANTGRLVASLPSVEAPRDSVDRGIRELRERLMGVVAVLLDERLEAFPGLEEHPPTFNAYLAFDRGLTMYNEQRYGPSAAEFRQAWSIDSAFVSPLIYAAMAHWNQDDFPWVDTLVRAAQQRRSRLSSYDQSQLDYLAALLASDGPRAIIAVERAARIAPSSRAAYNYGRDLVAMNRPADARRVLEDIDPDRGAMKGWQSYWTQLTHALHLVGDHAAELEAARKMRVRFPEARVAYVLESRALAALRNFAALDSLMHVTSGLRAPEYWSHGAALVVAGDEFMAHGDSASGAAYLSAGAQWLTEQLKVEPGRREHRYWLGSALYNLGGFRAAHATFSALVADYPDRFLYRGLAAVSRARLGDIPGAHRILGDPPAYARSEHTQFRARIALIAGDTTAARSLWQQSISEVASSFAWLHSSGYREVRTLQIQ